MGTLIWPAIRRGDSRGEQGHTAWRQNTPDSPYVKVGARAKPDIREQFLRPVGQLVSKRQQCNREFRGTRIHGGEEFLRQVLLQVQLHSCGDHCDALKVVWNFCQTSLQYDHRSDK
jgi:hypothetical protein